MWIKSYKRGTEFSLVSQWASAQVVGDECSQFLGEKKPRV